MNKFGLPGLALICFVLLPQTLAAAIWSNVDPQARATTTDSSWFRADEALLRARLAAVPHEILLDRSVTIELPMPDGSLGRFSIVESPILPGGFPGVKTFKLYGTDDSGASGRADITHRGFSAMLRTGSGLVIIDPEPGAGRLYQSYYRRAAGSQPFACGVHARNEDPLAHLQIPSKPVNRLAGNYQTYRIAVSATNDYVAAIGSKAAARAEIVTTINRVNVVYENDLGIRLLLVGNDGDLLEDDDEECFSNSSAGDMLAENQVWVDERLGTSAYDIGHVFSTFNGGVAFLGAACQGTIKAGGVSGLPSPLGDPFYIDIVAHEIGHQLSADHTFNGTTGACGGINRNGATAVEPGSGSTVMAYAGICDVLTMTENLQNNSDAMFHARSMSQIDAFTAAGGSCNGVVATGNNDPTLTSLPDLSIPAQTPFRLQVVAADVDLDTLTYQWDQMDVGQSTNDTNFGTDLGSNTLFRSYPAQTDAWRDFPALGTQVQGVTDKAETLPTTGRDLDFRVTVLDGNGGQVADSFTLTSVAGAGFRITSDGSAGGTLDTTVAPVTPYTITWDTANSENAPVSCANVDIELLTFSNATYDQYSIHTILLNTANDGSEAIATSLPNSHPRARIRVKCSSSVFYHISDTDLNVVGTSATPYGDTANSTFFNTNGAGLTLPRPGRSPVPTAAGRVELFAGAARPTSAARVEECVAEVRRSNGDSTAFDPWWLMLLSAMLLIRRRRVRACSES